MYVFILDDSRATKEAAACLLRADEGGPASRLFIPDVPGSFFGMKLADLVESYWLGHMHGDDIGGATLRGFVDKFTADFESQFSPEGKIHVQHLYLIGCEAGLTGRDTPMAQCMADLMCKNGFSNIRVHAVVNPTQPDTAMVVKVVTGSQHSVTLPGEVYAIRYDTKTFDDLHAIQQEIDELENKCKTPCVYTQAIKLQMRRQLRKKLDEKSKLEKEGIRFLETCNIKAELNRPHNTFIPDQPLQRPEKIMAQELALVQIDQHIKRLAFVGATKPSWQEKFDGIVYRATHHKSPGIKLLVALRQELGAQVGQGWWRVLEQYKDQCDQQTETGRLINRLYQDARPPHLVIAERTNMVVKSGKRRIASIFQGFTSKTPEMPGAMSLAITLIGTQANQLERELKQTFFSQHIKSYKAKKLKELTVAMQAEFDQHPDAPDWIPLVENAMKDSKLVQGVFSHRTYDLLRSILDRQRLSEHTPLLTRAR